MMQHTRSDVLIQLFLKSHAHPTAHLRQFVGKAASPGHHDQGSANAAQLESQHGERSDSQPFAGG
jgi:hypothetical protein